MMDTPISLERQELAAFNALLGYVMKISGGKADLNLLDKLFNGIRQAASAPVSACRICGETAPRTGACGSGSPEALCNRQVALSPPAFPERSFRVGVAKMTESHQVTYHVILTNGVPPAEDSDLENAGNNGSSITPYFSASKDNAEHEAQAWAEFLGVTFTKN